MVVFAQGWDRKKKKKKKNARKFSVTKNGKRESKWFDFRASYNSISVKSSVKNMRKNGWLVRTIPRRNGEIDVYTRKK